MLPQRDGVTGRSDCADLLCRLALSDDATLRSILGAAPDGSDLPDLDDKLRALVRLGALIATESSAPAYQQIVGLAFAAGATEDEMVGVLLQIAQIVGTARASSAAPHLAFALGYDLDRRYED